MVYSERWSAREAEDECIYIRILQCLLRKGLMERERDQFPVGVRVLAVDDDPVCLKVLEVLLRRCQYHGEPSQAATIQNVVPEPPSVDKERSALELSVSAPGRVALPSAAPNLKNVLDPCIASPSSLGQGEVNAAVSSQSNASLSQMDERELKRERRKQSNRESARRSRLRKQAVGPSLITNSKLPDVGF